MNEVETAMYLVFAGNSAHPLGGWQDYRGSYHTRVDARAALWDLCSGIHQAWGQIVSLETDMVVERWTV